jgi:hypothetical protein
MRPVIRSLLVAICFSVAGWFGNDAWRAHQAWQASSAGPASSRQAAAPSPKLHNYEVKDGMDYGYTRALSDAERNAGKAAPSVIMFRYAGERDGRHQVHASDGTTFTALECERPCRVIKSMSFVDADYLRDKVHVERLTYQSGTVAAAVFDDVFAGQLRQYGVARGTKSYQVWVDERAGRREHLVKPATATP